MLKTRVRNGFVTDACRLRSQEGFALLAVIFALVVLAAISVITLRTSGIELKAGRAVRESERAYYAAETGANEVIAGWDQALYDSLLTGPGDSLVSDWVTLGNRSSYGSVVRRVDDGSGPKMYSVVVAARGAGIASGQRTVGVMLSLSDADVDVTLFAPAAVALGGNTELVSDPTSTIDGNDTNPPGWTSCGSPGAAMPGVIAADSLSQGSGTILGDPPIAVDPTIDPSTFTDFGDVTYDDMVAMADKTYPPASEPGSFGPAESPPGTCDTSVQSNWGDPLNPGSPCSDYFPIIHFQGDVEFTTTGSAGQGIMLVDGNLAVGGGDFTFYGLIIIQGSCVFEYESTVYGGVLCASGGGEIGDAAPMSYSSCVLKAALSESGVASSSGGARPLAMRAWSEPIY